MNTNLSTALESAGIEISTFEKTINWALSLAERERLRFDHTECDGMRSDFDLCEHKQPETAELIKKRLILSKNL